MNKKRKIQYYLIIFCIVALILLMVYIIGSSIYGVVARTKTSHKILAEFNERYESEEIQVIVFASPACKWCKQFIPVLDELSKENDFEYYYLNVLEILDSDIDKISEKTGIQFSGIPHLVVIKNKEVLAEQKGAESKETTYELLKNVGIIKEGVEEDGESISTGS